MNREKLDTLQAPLKARYRTNPKEARTTLRAKGAVGSEAVICNVETGRAPARAGLHPATGGSGFELCPGDMLLEALVACTGVTLKTVATALDIPLKGAQVFAEGDLDFRGTLGVDGDARVGFEAIRLRIEVDTMAGQDRLDQLIDLTERYCVVLQTLKGGTRVSAKLFNLPPLNVDM